MPAGGTGIGFAPGYDAANHYLGVSYTAGNPQNDGAHAYTWDPNWGSTLSIDTTTLVYDAMGRTVEQQNGTTFTEVMYGPTGKLALMNGQTEIQSFEPLPGGGTFVHRPGSLTNYWRHPNWLGSSGLATTLPGRIKFYDGAYAPFGEDYNGTGTKDLSFTGQTQDTTTTVGGLYDFTFREYAPRQGRWISPDPAGLGAVTMENPQTWNRYAYVGNTPLAATDPLGLNSSLRPPLPGNPSGLCGFIGAGAPFEPHSCDFGDAPNGARAGTKGFCILDGVISDCGFIQLEATVNCPQCKPGQGVGMDNMIYGWVAPTYGRECVGSFLDAACGPYTLIDPGGWEAVGKVDAANNCQAPFLCNSQNTISTISAPKQWKPAPSTFLRKYAAQLSCEGAVTIADIGNMDDQGGIYAPTLALAAALGSKTPWVAVTGTVVFGAITLETAIDAREKCTSVWNQ